LRDLAHFPEVYADAQVTTTGTLTRGSAHGGVVYVLDGGHGTRIVLESATRSGRLRIARLDGVRVRVSGLFTVTFQLGYEILISRISPAATL
jgi:hypothetical protein